MGVLIGALMLLGVAVPVGFQIGKSILDMRRGGSVALAVGRISGFLLIAAGFLGFVGSMMLSSGLGKHLPDSFELPIGTRSEALFDADGNAYVPIKERARIQVYHKDGTFVRGWYYETFGGGGTNLWLVGDTVIRVATARQSKLFFYGKDGSLRKFEDYRPLSYSSFVEQPYSSFRHETPFLTAPFTTVVGSWAMAILGMLLDNLADHLAKRRKKRQHPG